MVDFQNSFTIALRSKAVIVIIKLTTFKCVITLPCEIFGTFLTQTDKEGQRFSFLQHYVTLPVVLDHTNIVLNIKQHQNEDSH